MKQIIAVLAVTACVIGCTLRQAEAAQTVLVENGQARAVVILPAQADKNEKQAAEELVTYIEKISGAKLAVITKDQARQYKGMARILLGSTAKGVITKRKLDQALGPRRDELSCRDGFVIKTGRNVLAISGVRSTGTLFGTYEFLEQLGCRWFWPGELGEVVPSKTTLAVEKMNIVQTPSFDMRQMWFSGDHAVSEYSEPWQRRNRLSLDYEYSGGHAYHPKLSDPQASKKKADELIEQLRKRPDTKWFSLSYHDTWVTTDQIGDKSLGLLHPWNNSQYNATDALIAYYNGVAERVEKEYPGRLFGFLVYNNYFLPPVKYKLHPSLSPWFAPIEQCPRHPPGPGRCWQRDAMFKILQSWCRISDKVFIYDYEPNFLVNNGVPMPSVTRFAVEMPLMHKLGVRGILQQSQLSIMNEGPNLWVRAKLMWDANADVGKLLDEYYSMLFGPAGKDVRSYWDTLEKMIQSGPGHQLHAYYFEDEIIKVLYPIEKVRQLETLVRQAESLADTDIRRSRVQVIRFSYDNLMLYLRMREAEDQAKFAQAATLADEILKLRHKIDKINTVLYKIGDLDRNDEGPEHMHMPGGWARFNRARQGRIDGTKGDLVALLPEQWLFKTDPNQTGIIYRWFETSHNVSDWKSLSTTRCWEVQGYETPDGHGYDGIGWYRTQVTVPARFAGRKLQLNFGGVFGQMLVWVNGEFASYQSYGRPWWYNSVKQDYDIDVTGVIKPGQSNVIVIRVNNEHEWGGIFRRVLLWSLTTESME